MSRKLNWIIKKIILYIRVAGLTSKRQLDVKKLQSDFYDFIKFSAKRQLLLLLLPTTSATSPSNDDVKPFEMK